MRYEELPPISRSDFGDACEAGDSRHRTEAILRLALHGDDPMFIGQAIVNGLDDDDFGVRRAAVLSIGHMARLHRCVTEEMLARLNSFASDPKMAGTVSDALDDISIFVRP